MANWPIQEYQEDYAFRTWQLAKFTEVFLFILFGIAFAAIGVLGFTTEDLLDCSNSRACESINSHPYVGTAIGLAVTALIVACFSFLLIRFTVLKAARNLREIALETDEFED